uniref:pyridoxal 5'-phosphate synthase n=1 Tax=Phallusia mammillata TaxID=59560 RepID=A0A6F9DPS8_9ASCI|nr:pyridoxine-5'-phosphate oxidase-like [Phallusia mammillata]
MSKAHLSDVRAPYKDGDHLNESSLGSKNPLKLFEIWFDIARNTESIKEPNAMTLATVNGEGQPSARMVLLKDFGPNGFVFFTNYRSAKAKDLEMTPYAALVLYWVDLCRSIRIEGSVEKLPVAESEHYFKRRPRASQISAHVSQFQSSSIESRQALEDMAAKIETQYKDKPIPKPEYWGGFTVRPKKMEFWQGQSSRMSDRIVFVRQTNDLKTNWLPGEDGWCFQRLQP